MVKFDKVNKSFGRLRVLKDVSLELTAGATAIIGPNGSGKTTLLKSLLGLVIPDSGTISVDGENVIGGWNYRSRIGYMSQISRFPENLRVGELFEMVKDIRSEVTVYDEDLYNTFRLNDIQNKALGTLSGGTKQKVSSALAFLFNPKIVILDEPTAGLDPVATEQIKDKIRNEKSAGKLIIITSHIMSDIEELTDNIIYIIDGVIRFHWPIAEVKRQTGEESFGKAMARITESYGDR